jgi:hypothetical protein
MSRYYYAALLSVCSIFSSCKKEAGSLNRLTDPEFITLKNTSPTKDDLKRGLAAYWPFNGDATDGSGNRNNGTVNYATLTKDRFGRNNKAYLFNGTTANIKVPHSNSLQINDKITMTCWIKPFTLPTNGNVQGIISKALAGYYANYGLIYANFNNNPNIHYSYTWWPIGVKINWAENQWHFLLISVDESGNSMQIIIDGVNYSNIMNLLTENPQTDFNSSGNMIIDFVPYDLYIGRGSNEANDATGFNGVIDEVRIYNRLLTVTEIASLMKL